MTLPFTQTTLANSVDLRVLVKTAAEKIRESEKPKVLVWANNTLQVLNSNTKRAAQAITLPNCLGVYDFGATRDQIMLDLEAVISSEQV